MSDDLCTVCGRTWKDEEIVEPETEPGVFPRRLWIHRDCFRVDCPPEHSDRAKLLGFLREHRESMTEEEKS